MRVKQEANARKRLSLFYHQYLPIISIIFYSNAEYLNVLTSEYIIHTIQFVSRN